MGLRFRKSAKIAPGVLVSLGKDSASVSVGGKGGRYTLSSSGRRTTSVGVPGTGLSYVSSNSGRPRSARSSKTNPAGAGKRRAVYGVLLIVIAFVALLLGAVSFSVGGWIFLAIGAPCLLLGVYYLYQAKTSKARNKGQQTPET